MTCAPDDGSQITDHEAKQVQRAIDSGWREVADQALEFVRRFN